MRLLVAIAIVAALVSIGGWFLLRDSAVVAIDHVTITGESGSDAAQIRSALDSAARTMTTLDFQSSRLRAAVSQFPEVKGLRVTTHFPHGVVIHVIELLPVATVRFAGGEVAVTGDGTLLPKVPVSGSLPSISLAEPPIGSQLQQGWELGAARLLAAAPRRVLPRLSDVMTVSGHGLVAQVRNGPSVYFGDGTQLGVKWASALAVLADPGSQGASYIDVTDPERPVAGVAGDSSTGSATGTSTGVSSGASAPAGSGSNGQTTSGTSTSTGTGTTGYTAPTGG